MGILSKLFARKTSTECVIWPQSAHGLKKEDLHPHALSVIKRLQGAGYQAYIVGGGVRDQLLKLHPKDFDVATDAHPNDVKKLFSNCRLIGRRFRLAHIHFGRYIIEVATFRGHSDKVCDQSNKSNKHGIILRDNIYGTLEEDVLRRDLTVNALYYDPIAETVVDYVGGMDDIRTKTICMIGEPNIRYKEDPVRILRSIRFANKLGFKINNTAQKAIVKTRHLLDHMPPGRIFDEYQKLFFHGKGLKNFKSLVDFQVMEYLFPQAKASIKDPSHKKLIEAALISTDQRIKDKQGINPGFLTAVFLWDAFIQARNAMKAKHSKRYPARIITQEAIEQVLRKQQQSSSSPKRFTHFIAHIWRLQYPLEHFANKPRQKISSHPTFKAAYDFLALRATIEPIPDKVVQFWEQEKQKLNQSQEG